MMQDSQYVPPHRRRASPRASTADKGLSGYPAAGATMAVKVRNSDITGSDSVDRLGRILLGLESTLSELYTTLGCIYGLTTAQQERVQLEYEDESGNRFKLCNEDDWNAATRDHHARKSSALHITATGLRPNAAQHSPLHATLKLQIAAIGASLLFAALSCDLACGFLLKFAPVTDGRPPPIPPPYASILA